MVKTFSSHIRQKTRFLENKFVYAALFVLKFELCVVLAEPQRLDVGNFICSISISVTQLLFIMRATAYLLTENPFIKFQ